MASRAGCIRGESNMIHSSFNSVPRLFFRYTHTFTRGNEVVKASKVAEKEFISPQLKRDLLEERMKSTPPPQYKICGLPNPNDHDYDAVVRSMFEDLKMRQSKQ